MKCTKDLLIMLWQISIAFGMKKWINSLQTCTTKFIKCPKRGDNSLCLGKAYGIMCNLGQIWYKEKIWGNIWKCLKINAFLSFTMCLHVFMCDESWNEQAKKGTKESHVQDETWNKQWAKRWLKKVGMLKRAWKRGSKISNA